MSTHFPEGMYPLDVDYDESRYDTFEEFKRHAEGISDSLNLPLSWFREDDASETEHGAPYFMLVFHMPRKNKNFSIVLNNPGPELDEWFEPWHTAQIATWFGWGDRVLVDRAAMQQVITASLAHVRMVLQPATDALRKLGLLEGTEL